MKHVIDKFAFLLLGLFLSAMAFLCLAVLAIMTASKARAEDVQCPASLPGDRVIVGVRSWQCNTNNTFSASVILQVTKVTATERTVYRLVQNLGPSGNGTIVMVSAGTATVDTSCDATQSVSVGGKNYYRVPRSAVTWVGSNRPAVVWGLCPG